MPYVTSQNTVITTERNQLISKQHQGQRSPSERVRLRDIVKHYKVEWSGNTRKILWNTLLEHVDIIPTSMVATMIAAESGWRTSRLARSNNNLFGIKCVKGRRTDASGKVRGYLQFNSVKESVSTYTTNLNAHPVYSLLHELHAQLHKADQGVTATAMIRELKGYSIEGRSHSNYLFAMYQDSQWLITIHT